MGKRYLILDTSHISQFLKKGSLEKLNQILIILNYELLIPPTIIGELLDLFPKEEIKVLWEHSNFKSEIEFKSIHMTKFLRMIEKFSSRLRIVDIPLSLDRVVENLPESPDKNKYKKAIRHLESAINEILSIDKVHELLIKSNKHDTGFFGDWAISKYAHDKNVMYILVDKDSYEKLKIHPSNKFRKINPQFLELDPLKELESL